MKKITLILFLIASPLLSSSQEIEIGQTAQEIQYIVSMGVNYHPNASWDKKYENGKIANIVLCYYDEYLIDVGISSTYCKYFVMENEKLAYIITQYENISVDQLKKYYDRMEDKIRDGDKYYDRDYSHYSTIYLHQNKLATIEWRKSLKVDNNAFLEKTKKNDIRFGEVWNVKDEKSEGLERFSIKIFKDFSCYIEMTFKEENYSSIMCDELNALLSNGKDTLKIRYGMPELQGVDIFIENNGETIHYSSWDVQN